MKLKRTITLLLLAGMLHAMLQGQSRKVYPGADEFRPFNLKYSMGFGADVKRSVITGVVTNLGDQVTLGLGGIHVFFGAGWTSKKNYGVSAQFDEEGSWTSPEISNGDGRFDRSFLSLNGIYFLRFSRAKLQSIRFEAGIKQLLNAQMLLDFDEIKGRNLEEFNYKSRPGFHFYAGYDIYTSKRKRALFHVGIDYSRIRYKIKSIRIDGQGKPLEYWDSSIFPYDMKSNVVWLQFGFSYCFGKAR